MSADLAIAFPSLTPTCTLSLPCTEAYLEILTTKTGHRSGTDYPQSGMDIVRFYRVFGMVLMVYCPGGRARKPPNLPDPEIGVNVPLRRR